MNAPVSLAPAVARAVREGADKVQESPGAITDCLDAIYRASRDSLEREKSSTKFVSAWLLYSLSSEILRYTIEDDAVDIRRYAEQLINAILRFNGEVDIASIEGLLAAMKTAAHSRPISTRELLFRIGKQNLYAKFNTAKTRTLPVSNTFQKELPILENSVADPALARGLIDAYADRIAVLKNSENIDHLCFVEKPAGPIGALALLGALVERVNLPACVYREHHWLTRAQLSGKRPAKRSKVLIVYDLVVTGNGVRDAATKLREKHEIDVRAALVLYRYSEESNEDMGGVKVEALVDQADFATAVVETSKSINDRVEEEFPHPSEGATLSDNFESGSPLPTEEDTVGKSKFEGGTTQYHLEERSMPSQRWFPDVPNLEARIESAREFVRNSSDSDFEALVASALAEDKPARRKKRKS